MKRTGIPMPVKVALVLFGVVGLFIFAAVSWGAQGSIVEKVGHYGVGGLPPLPDGTSTGSVTTHADPLTPKVYKIDWTSNTSGSVEQVLSNPYVGKIVKMAFVGDATSPPITLYDVSLTDHLGIDVLGNRCQNIVSNSLEGYEFVLPMPRVLGWHTLVIDNATTTPGADELAIGTIWIYIE